MSGTSVIKQVGTTDLHSFIDSINQYVNGLSKIELVRKALNILPYIPASRDIALDFFTTLYEKWLLDELGAIEVIHLNFNLFI